MIEAAILNHVAKSMFEIQKSKRLEVQFVESEKNRILKDILPKIGFSKKESIYSIEIKDCLEFASRWGITIDV